MSDLFASAEPPSAPDSGHAPVAEASRPLADRLHGFGRRQHMAVATPLVQPSHRPGGGPGRHDAVFATVQQGALMPADRRIGGPAEKALASRRPVEDATVRIDDRDGLVRHHFGQHGSLNGRRAMFAADAKRHGEPVVSGEPMGTERDRPRP